MPLLASLTSFTGRGPRTDTADADDPIARDFAHLPPPAVASTGSSSRPLRASKLPKKSARIDGRRAGRLNLRVQFAKIKRRLGSGTAPSTSEMMDESAAGSSVYRTGGRGASTPGVIGDDEKADEQADAAEVDEVVVDREWLHDLKSSIVSPSEHGDTLGRAGSPGQGGTTADFESAALHASGFWGLWMPLLVLRWRVWPSVYDFFFTHFYDEKSEVRYRKENWFMKKSLAVWSACFLIINWVLATAFIPRPLALMDKIWYFGVAPALTFPVLFMVMFNFPRDHVNFYQFFVSVSVWSWSIYQLLFLYLCGYYGQHSYFKCGSKDFIGTFYYTIGLPTIAMFGLKLHRLPFAMGAVAFFSVACPLVLVYKKTWYRNLLNFIIYVVFLLYVHYMRENAERRLYTLRDQLKIQFRATQKAQVNERKAADSKRRLTSYVFHEVRVPLNTALLAVQNMAATGIFARAQDVEFKALEGSLSMMSKVLNDVLDFNRMDSGRFESVSKPYPFHHVMRSMFVPLRLATDARNLQFLTDLDPRIDAVARRAAYQSMGGGPADVARRLAEHPHESGVVVGDEMRLRQIITNLASNACKFTPAGGSLKIATRLLWPAESSRENEAPGLLAVSEAMTDRTKVNGDADGRPAGRPSSAGDPEKGQGQKLSATLLSRHNESEALGDPPLEKIIVRIEVTDTGCGIQNKDMVHNKLFSAFNQTEMGRQQGGKGTGLGLALVRQIVKRSGGRLGVRSKVGEGSTFWVELPLGVGAKAVVESSRQSMSQDRSSSDLDILGHGDVQFRPTMRTDQSASTVATSDTSPKRNSTPHTNAMHGIMEQGGLFELMSPQETDSNVSIPTRAIGDRHTGTDPLPSPDTPLADLPRKDAPTRPVMHDESSSQTILARSLANRPHHIELPKATFGLLPPMGSPSAKPPSQPSSPPALPRVAELSGVFAPEPRQPPRMPVLVVDDDYLTRTLMKRMLTRLGCAVTTAENGALAAALILGTEHDRPTPSSEFSPVPPLRQDDPGGPPWSRESKYAVVFLDNQMPVMSGLQAVAKVRSAGRRDFIVGVTGNALLADQEEYLEAGVDNVLTKPVLEKSLKNMLALAQQHRAQLPPIGTETSMTTPPATPPSQPPS